MGPAALDGLCGADVDAVLERDCVGVSMPAGAFGASPALGSLGEVLGRLEELDAPLFIHPGPGLGSRPEESSLADRCGGRR